MDEGSCLMDYQYCWGHGVRVFQTKRKTAQGIRQRRQVSAAPRSQSYGLSLSESFPPSVLPRLIEKSGP